MNIPTRKSVLTLAVAASLSSTVQAAEENDTIVVTASLTGIEAEKLGRAHTVITAEELEHRQIRYLADALRQAPGLAVSQLGAYGGLTQIRIRGSEANHVLLLIDGIEVSEAGTGEYDLSGLQVANIERIEILRGPQSAFWGSNATAGVINVITKSGQRQDQSITITSEAGSDNTRQLGLNLLGGKESFDYSLSGSFRSTDGFNVSDFGSEKDGDINRTLHGKLNFDLTEQLRLTLSSRYINRDSDADEQDFAFPATATQGRIIDSDAFSDTEEWANAAILNWHQGPFSQQFKLEQSQNDRRSKTGFGDSGSDTQRWKAAYQLGYEFESDNAVHNITGGIEREREQFENVFPASADQAGERKRTLTGYVLQYQGDIHDRLFLTAATRFDNNDRFKNATTYSLSAAYRLNNGARLHSSVGTGVTNPTFFEQFGFSPSTFIGNPDLKPEENFGWDLGIELPLANSQTTLDITYFQEKLENEIVTVFDSNFFSTPQNSDGYSHRKGVELTLNTPLGKQINASASYTYTDSTDASDLDEVRRPRHSGALNLSWHSSDERTDAFLDAVYNGEMDDLEFISATPESRVTLDGYWRLNLGASYQLNETVQLFGRIENLLDEEYEEVFDYNAQGRTALVGVSARF